MNRSAAVIGWGKSGQGAAGALLARDWSVRAYASRATASLSFDDVADVPVHVEEDANALAAAVLDARPDLVVVSPGIPAHHPIFAACEQAGIDLWGEVELAWRLQEEGPHAGRPWLTVTGTNGKTTTVGMLGQILRASGVKAEEVGNIGTPITRAIDSDAEVFAVELSSFQLHTARTVRPLASVCLNVDADHLDWHGSVEAYAADKARVYENTVRACVYPASDRRVEAMVEDADVVEGARAIGLTLGAPSVCWWIARSSMIGRATHWPSPTFLTSPRRSAPTPRPPFCPTRWPPPRWRAPTAWSPRPWRRVFVPSVPRGTDAPSSPAPRT